MTHTTRYQLSPTATNKVGLHPSQKTRVSIHSFVLDPSTSDGLDGKRQPQDHQQEEYQQEEHQPDFSPASDNRTMVASATLKHMRNAAKGYLYFLKQHDASKWPRTTTEMMFLMTGMQQPTKASFIDGIRGRIKCQHLMEWAQAALTKAGPEDVQLELQGYLDSTNAFKVKNSQFTYKPTAMNNLLINYRPVFTQSANSMSTNVEITDEEITNEEEINEESTNNNNDSDSPKPKAEEDFNENSENSISASTGSSTDTDTSMPDAHQQQIKEEEAVRKKGKAGRKKEKTRRKKEKTQRKKEARQEREEARQEKEEARREEKEARREKEEARRKEKEAQRKEEEEARRKKEEEARRKKEEETTKHLNETLNQHKALLTKTFDDSANVDSILTLLSADLVDDLHKIKDSVSDIVLDEDRRPTAWANDQRILLGEDADRVISNDEIAFVINNIGDFGEDNRAVMENQLHRISAMRNRHSHIIGLTLRVGRHVSGNAAMIADLLLNHPNSKDTMPPSILFLGEPGSGKTTAIRDVTRVLADRNNVVIIDTSNEIAGDGDLPHPCVGHARRLMVPTPNAQASVMVECVQNHTPHAMVLDEIGRKQEVDATRSCKNRGVRFVASAHGDLRQLVNNPKLVGLLGGIQSVILSDVEARKGPQSNESAAIVKVKRERSEQPVFDVIVELSRNSFNQWRVITDVATAVDATLNAKAFDYEQRTRDPTTGEMTVELKKNDGH